MPAGAATMSCLMSSASDMWAQVVPAPVSAFMANVTNNRLLENVLGVDHPASEQVKVILTTVLITAGLWFIFVNYFRSPVCLTHAEETNPINVWDEELQRVRKVPLDVYVKDHCPNLVRGVFYPTFWLFNGHIQTIYAAVIAMWPDRRLTYDREIINMPDGGILSLDWSPKLPPADSPRRKTLNSRPKPVVLILHGLTGGSHETYVQDTVIEVNKRGFQAVVMNARGCADTALTSSQLYSGSYTDDVRRVSAYLKRKLNGAPMFAVGFSLGANILTKFVGEEGKNAPFIGFSAVANPFDLLQGTHALHRTWFGRTVYSYKMAQNLVGVYKKHQKVIDAHPEIEFDAKQIDAIRSITEFDDAVTRRVFGFRTVHEYYRKGSSAQYVPDIEIPCLLFSALDDPIAHSEAIPVYEVWGNPNVILATTTKGGHIGWFEGIFKPTRWFARPLGDFIQAILSANESIPQDLLPQLEAERQEQLNKNEKWKHEHLPHPPLRHAPSAHVAELKVGNMPAAAPAATQTPPRSVSRKHRPDCPKASETHPPSASSVSPTTSPTSSAPPASALSSRSAPSTLKSYLSLLISSSPELRRLQKLSVWVLSLVAVYWAGRSQRKRILG
ncbi:hypothetical protein HDV05_003692 [Chytridiales sp. JEL 0842]|nr:hypothetical protein HDV05_003692 [Chytridiales sp. JEL 0842]